MLKVFPEELLEGSLTDHKGSVTMRYMESFNRRLRAVRDRLSLTVGELAELCGVEEREVLAWEASDPRRRQFPSVSELMDLCVCTETSLESLLDVAEPYDEGQLELPGLAFGNGQDLVRALDDLDKELQKVQLTGDEAELLRRFRKSSDENRKMILQLLGE